jgi:hypothetical protein
MTGFPLRSNRQMTADFIKRWVGIFLMFALRYVFICGNQRPNNCFQLMSLYAVVTLYAIFLARFSEILLCVGRVISLREISNALGVSA